MKKNVDLKTIKLSIYFYILANFESAFQNIALIRINDNQKERPQTE